MWEALGEMGPLRRILTGKSERKAHLERPRHRRENMIKSNLKE